MAYIYYLLSVKYLNFEIGSILQFKDKIIIDLDSTIEVSFDKAIPKDWIEITIHEMKWLIKRSISVRNLCHTQEHFKVICGLNKGQQCFYRSINGDILCTVDEKILNKGETQFNIILQDGIVKEIPSEDIELYTEESKTHKNMEDILKLLLLFKGDIQQTDVNGRCVLSMVYNTKNKIYFKMLLKSYNTLLDIGNKIIQNLLRDIVKDKFWDLLSLILAKCDIQENNNDFLPILTIEALKEDNVELLEIIFKFAPKLNKLKNGETFLTNLFKEDILEQTIIKVINMKLFDLNVPNNLSETPLTLACERLMEDVVKVLLDNGADAHHDNYKAQFIIHDLRSKDPAKEPQVIRITALLYSFQPKDKEKNKVITPTNVQPAEIIDNPLDAMGQIIQLLVLHKGNIVILNDKNESVLTISYTFPNKRFLNVLVRNYGIKFDLIVTTTGQSLLTKMVTVMDIDTLKVVLDECILVDANEVFLLNMALTTLKMKMKCHYKMIVEKCVNKNRTLSAGETFLTSCFKENVDDYLINDVLLSGYFDINVPNVSGQTPLMLACESLKSDLVKVLLDKQCDISHNNYSAIDIVVAKGNLTDNAEIRKAAKKLIFDLMCGKIAKENEKLKFTENGFVDITKISVYQKINFDIEIGDPVILSSLDSNGVMKEYRGEVKCFGALNHEICAGVELDDSYPFCINGVDNENFNFKCVLGHGVVTKVENIKLNVELLKLHYLTNNILDPNKFLKCKENWDELKNIKKNEKVYIENKNNIKGLLRWYGTMNGVVFGIIELDSDYDHGTNGRFGKNQLIKCAEKRAVAVKANSLRKFKPYTKKPIEVKTFDEIDIDSDVIYYHAVDGRFNDLYGVVKWSGVNENKEYLYGIELKEKFKDGTDGTFEGQKLFKCPLGHGVLVPITVVAPGLKEIIEESDKSEVSEKIHYSIPSLSSRFDFGIQGSDHSRFLDALILAFFAKYDVLDFIISPNFHAKEENSVTKKIKEILAYKIVYPLRKSGFVSFHHVKEMLEVTKGYGGNFKTMTTNKIDLENVMNLLQKLLPDEQLLNFIDFKGLTNQSMFLQLLVNPVKKNVFVTSQQILNYSMCQNHIKFNKAPTSLIMQLPKDAQGYNFYEKCIPSKTIKLNDLCNSYFKKCVNCDKMATLQCLVCIENSLDTKFGLFCNEHKCAHENKMEYKEDIKSKSELSMDLRAIICRDGDYFLTYIKKDNFKTEWICFNQIKNGDYYDPSLIFNKEVSLFLNKTEDEMKVDFYLDEKYENIIKNAMIFIYFNGTMTCY